MGSIGQYHDSHQRSTATYQLSIQDIFEGLSRQEQLYAHHLSQAAWHGARIILRQTSPEGNDIFDFIIELHKACQGQWNRFIDDFNVKEEELNSFLDYAGMFMSKMNNFCVSFCLMRNSDEIIANLRCRERATGKLSLVSQLVYCANWLAFQRLRRLF